MQTERSTIPLECFFKSYLDKVITHLIHLISLTSLTRSFIQSVFPISLKPREQHNVVVFLEPLTSNPAELSQISSKLSTLYTVKWVCMVLVTVVVLMVEEDSQLVCGSDVQ